jgi:hypothetical protein
MSPFWCSIVSVIIGAVFIVGGLALYALICFGVCKAWGKLTQFIRRCRKPKRLVAPEEKARYYERVARRGEIIERITQIAAYVLFGSLVIGLCYLFGNPTCEAVFHGR